MVPSTYSLIQLSLVWHEKLILAQAFFAAAHISGRNSIFGMFVDPIMWKAVPLILSESNLAEEPVTAGTTAKQNRRSNG